MRRYLISMVLVVMLVGCAYACQEIPPTEPPVDDPPVDEPPVVDEPVVNETPTPPSEPIVKEEPRTVGMQCTA
jgi:hypothetical protein